MHWIPLIIVLALLVLLFSLKEYGKISFKAAHTLLKSGALIIDVRTRSEFNAGHLASNINIPLDEIETALAEHVKDKKQVLLLHCASGIRSLAAEKKLHRMGYRNVFNLGSFSRARRILQSG